VSLELSGPEASRPYIDAAQPDHPSLLDPTHRMDALFGVVNIPNVVWIDEGGLIVRPAEPGWPSPRSDMPRDMLDAMPELGRAPNAPQPPADGPGQWGVLLSGQDRASYADAIRDWATKGADSEFALSADEVVARSQPRSNSASEGAARFELANHLWRSGRRDAAIAQFVECHRLQPDNWTYKRQAWSLVGYEQAGGGDMGRFTQNAPPGREDEWPFDSDFNRDVAKLGPGEYYPKTM
jgi:hypothetical protein